jgi:glucoamylase
MIESTNRPRDGAVTHAFSSFPGLYNFTDSKIAATIKSYNLMFCGIYPLNQQDIKDGIPGILYGRYQGDTYAGGNPWQLLTAVLAKLMYQGAHTAMLQGSPDQLLSAQELEHWQELYDLPAQATRGQFVEAASQAGDAVMFRLYAHVKDGNGHIAEQIDKVSGQQKSANDLTWSYGNILDALKFGKKVGQLRGEWL